MILFIFFIAILIFSIVIHEVAHGEAAYYLGDPTAKYAGRLTLNPLKHLDPVGSLLLPLFLVLVKSPFLIGWAKPVPINPRNFRDQKYGEAKVGFAGPLANILIALVFGILSRLLPLSSILKNEIISATLKGFGGREEPLLRLIQGSFTAQIFSMFIAIVFINILLAIFNLVPIPPLDGSHILFAFLPYSMENIKIFLHQYGLFILIFFIFFCFHLILPVIFGLFYLIVGVGFF
jgi:Zn-dependent protease